MHQVLLSVVMLPALVRASECGGCWCINETEACPPEPRQYGQLTVEMLQRPRALNARSLANDCDPYAGECETPAPAAACAVVYEDAECSRYRLEDVNETAGQLVTHYGNCGACSTLFDLAGYMAHEDMTTLGKRCGVAAALDLDAGIDCYRDTLNLTRPCAEIWAYDARYDARHCAVICALHADEPNNGPPPNCTLNPCLACDEDEAGPLFKAFAGRTRRNSGLQSSIARPCESISNLSHHALCGA